MKITSQQKQSLLEMVNQQVLVALDNVQKGGASTRAEDKATYEDLRELKQAVRALETNNVFKLK